MYDWFNVIVDVPDHDPCPPCSECGGFCPDGTEVCADCEEVLAWR